MLCHVCESMWGGGETCRAPPLWGSGAAECTGNWRGGGTRRCVVVVPVRERGRRGHGVGRGWPFIITVRLR